MRAADYSRVSTEEQSEHGHSIDEQKDRNLDHIQKNSWTLVARFSDPGFSGKNLKRPDMKKLLVEVEKGHLDVIVVHKLDRLTRNIGDLYDLLKLFEKHKVQFVSVSENIDTSTAMGRMVVFLLGILAQWYRENLGEEVRKGMRGRAKKGLHIVSVPMFGYSLDKSGNLNVKPDEAKWVQWIYEQYIAGIGSTNIAKRLNEMGIRRNRGGLWDQHKVMLTLTNLHYVGKVHWKEANLPEEKRVVETGKHEAIIQLDMFEKAQHILERRRKGQVSKNSYDYVFGGIIRCGKCSGSFKGKYNKRPSGLYRGYVCYNNEKYGTCDHPGISEMKLTKLIFQTVVLETDEKVLSDLAKVSAKEHITERDAIIKQIEASETRRERWQLAYGDGNMPYKDFSKRMREEMDKVTELEELLDKYPEEPASSLSPAEAFELLLDISSKWNGLDQNTKKRIVQSLFREIAIKKYDGSWTIDKIVLA